MVQKKQKQIDTPHKNSNPSELSELESSDSSESVQFTQVAASYSGPLPPSSAFEQYENVHAGSAIRILDMAEKEQSHRIDWEMTTLNANHKHQNRGQYFGLITAILCIVGACYMATIDQPWPAAILAGASVIGLVRAFVDRRKLD